jgi:hypothetical protein
MTFYRNPNKLNLAAPHRHRFPRGNMTIIPKELDLIRWTRSVPTDGDLLFFDAASRKIDLPVPVITPDEVRSRAVELWNLNDRSWYGYAISDSDFCAWFPRGLLEKQDEGLRSKLEKIQIRMGVPTIIKRRLLSASLRRHFPASSLNCWMTSQTWRSLDKKEKVDGLRAWFLQNEIAQYESVRIADLSSSAAATLRKIKMRSLANGFSHSSGPNCFAAVAGCIADTDNLEIAKQWLHWPALERWLKTLQYKMVRNGQPTGGDALIFVRNGIPVHGAYALDEELYFEKPGQDFYEPYRIASFKSWKTEWPKSKLIIYRLRGS